jgi:hypothetical protein
MFGNIDPAFHLMFNENISFKEKFWTIYSPYHNSWLQGRNSILSANLSELFSRHCHTVGVAKHTTSKSPT